MTGTPVENSISDLWAVTDIAALGYFPPLREFMKKYGKDQDAARQKALEGLSQEVLQKAHVNEKVIPPYAFRRLKEDVAKDLPPKHEGPMIRRFMPPLQARRYADLSAATQPKRFNLLRALHDFRSISLHPADPEAVGAGAIQPDEYIQMSARLTEAFSKLFNIAIRNEKELIFVNSRRMQNVLARLIAYKFGCPRPEYIRGDTAPGRRQEIVNRFSALSGFAVLILSPRAAGVGLNIVAANHVIHLDRWWNPAVEDQCTDRAYRIGATKDVFVHTIGAVHPQLGESSYDVVLDQLLRQRREISRRIFTSSEITAADFAEVLASQASRQSPPDLLNEIDRAEYLGLEEFVRDIVIAQGLAATLTRSTGDGGADIVIRNELDEIKYLIQCKHANKIDVPIDAGLVQDAKRVRENWRAEGATVVGVTNAKAFAPRVVAEFERIRGRLIARNELVARVTRTEGTVSSA
jgi:HJR/Mrr/RecB family endonuclease